MLKVNKYNLEEHNLTKEIWLTLSQGYQVLKAGIDPESDCLSLWVLENTMRMSVPVRFIVAVPNQALNYHAHDLIHIDTVFEYVPLKNDHVSFVWHVFQVEE